MAREELSDLLSEFARTMVTDFPIQRILDHLVRRIVDIMPISAAGVTLISADLDPHYVAASNQAALQFEQLQTELGEGPCLAAYHTGATVSVPDLRRETRFPAFGTRALEIGLAAVFTFPLRHGHHPLGALDLYSDVPGPLSPESLAVAQTLADVAAAYVLNAQGRAELQDSTDRSAEAALHDPLTGLPNRVLIFERLEHAFRRAQRSTKIAAVFFVDLNRFKAINDTFGHRVGDEVLVAVAARLTGILRPGDTLARLSGDEFVILCEDLDDPAQADAIAIRIGEAMEPRFVLSDAQLTVTASIGIAFTGRESQDPAQLMQDADLAMYGAKRRRDLSPEVLDLRELHLAELQTGPRRALPGASHRGELHLSYQPIVATDDGRLTGVEALLRWRHPDRGLVSPAVVIPLAETSGLSLEIGRWVLEHAWSDRHRWQSTRAADLAMSVNVSTRHLMSAGFTDTVATVLASAPTHPALLTLEVPETVLLGDSDRARVVLNDLKGLGVTLALDRFGTGYSSLSYLMKYPIDVMKSDRTLVTNLGRDSAGDAAMNTVVQVAHGLGMKIVAGGVETAEQHRHLIGLSCDFCQGFYFGRPMSHASIGALIEEPGSDRRLPRGVGATLTR